MSYICSVCRKSLHPSDAYEYRGQIACDDHFDLMCENRDKERNAVMQEEQAKLARISGFDFGDNAIGRANRELLAGPLRAASTESAALKAYEKR